MTRVIQKSAILALFLGSLTACSSLVTDLQDVVKYAVLGPPSTELTQQQLEDLPYAGQYVTVGEQPKALVLLGYDDNNRLSWISSTEEMVITRQGRIVGSHGLNSPYDTIEHALVTVENITPDPLACIIQSSQAELCNKNWKAIAYAGEGVEQQRYAVSSQFNLVGEERLTLANGITVNTQQWQETVTTQRADETWSYTNSYWLAEKSRRVVQSIQQLTPAFPKTVMQEVKRYTKVEETR